MRSDIYKYQFNSSAPMPEVEATLSLAVVATESLHGQPDVRLDASYVVDEKARAIVVDATTDVGRCICRVFAGFLAREFGEDSFEVRRVKDGPVSAEVPR